MFCRRALDQGFDYVYYLDENQNKANLKLDDFAKLYSLLALKSFDSCVYVSPYMVALKNCDDIFSMETEGVVMVDGDEKASIFSFKPSMDNYMALTTSLMTWKSNGIHPYFICILSVISTLNNARYCRIRNWEVHEIMD